MRILPITQKWPKLKKPRWTTFRLRRRDRDWEVGEIVQVVLHPRSKGRVVLGIAKIVSKELRHFWCSSSEGELIGVNEAMEDGFDNILAMRLWMIKVHGRRAETEPLNKLTLEWLYRGPILD
jgi:hypothetical protein